MTDKFDQENPDDFLDPEVEGVEAPAAAKGGVAGNLAEAWRSRPLFKFMVLVAGVFAVGIAGINFFGGGQNGTETAYLSKAPAFHEAPGGPSSPYMRKQTEMANSERSEQAIASGGSAVPTPLGPTTDVSGYTAEKKDDPLKELRVETEVLKKQLQQQQIQQQQMQQQVQTRPPEQFDNSLAEAMQRQMQQMMESWNPRGIKSVTVVRPDDLKDEKARAAAQSGVGGAQTAAAGATNASTQARNKIVVTAGTVSYAQLLTEANSDVPGPIMAQIVSGPLSGARAIGSFQVANGYEKYLVLKFSLADKKGKDYQINAIALDPDTTLGGMATEVDERYFARVVLPAAAGFLQGMGQALGQGGSSVTTNGTTSITTQASNGYKQGIYNGLGMAAQTAGQFFQEQANQTKPLVRVAAGTPMGLFFVAPVYESQASGTGDGTMATNAAGMQGIQGMQGMYGYGQQAGTNGSANGYYLQGAGNSPYPNYTNPAGSYYGYSNNTRSSAMQQYSSFGQ